MLIAFLASALAVQPAPAPPTPARLREGSILNADYPPEAIRIREQGRSSFRLDLSENGQVLACTIEESSGSAILDTATCSLAQQRFKFDPARDSAGRPVRSTFSSSVRWVLPEDGEVAPGAPMPFGSFEIVLTATLRDGVIVSCTHVAGTTDRASMDASLCEQGMSLARFPLAVRKHFATATQIIAFTPEGMTQPVARPEWGKPLLRAEADIAIAADGAVADCTNIRLYRGSGAEAFPAPQACSLRPGGAELFEPSRTEEVRRAHAMFAIFVTRKRASR